MADIIGIDPIEFAKTRLREIEAMAQPVFRPGAVGDNGRLVDLAGNGPDPVGRNRFSLNGVIGADRGESRRRNTDVFHSNPPVSEPAARV